MMACRLQEIGPSRHRRTCNSKSFLVLFFMVSLVQVSGFDISRSTSIANRIKTNTRQQPSHSNFQTPKQQQQQTTATDRSSSKSSRLSMQAASSSVLTPTYPIRVAVMGGGNFGLAMGAICARQGLPTTILVRDEEIANAINRDHRHPRYMKDIELPTRLRATADPKECLPDATYIIHAVPCQYSRKFLESVKDFIPPQTPILSVSKGIETSSMGFMADVIRDVLGEDRPLAFLSGPSFAREIVEGVGATAVVIASEDLDLARDLAALISDGRFKCFTSTDVIGVEVGGAVKNVIALGAGMCEGLGLGTNAMSGLVTRGCNEMRRLGMTFGAKSSTIAGLSGVGDTFGTCFGPLSRNRKFGYRLGKGETMEEILASTSEVAEGVDTALAVVRLIEKECKGYRLDLKYPILFGIARILEGKSTPLEGLEGLMNMPMQMENFDEGKTRFTKVRRKPRRRKSKVEE
uniref:Glycerol-3-phosphate dehydrogenase [NAD(+)] n=1 Tax=Pseudo-nitzschia australis TaxID=44445 RepID=A0A7S4AJR7_9STRA|mmetsp:Transcript_11486/g.24238  ORF Transcript_11486/g.24238 Transcript_11486/m.24238 type:complete len:463 (+) Transcript_11486:380-1768(+)